MVSRFKSRLLGGLSVAGVIVSPAHAILQIAISVDGAVTTCVDNASCDTNPATGQLDMSGFTASGVTFDFANAISTSPGPTDDLNMSTSIDNTTEATTTVIITVSDTGFSAPVNTFITIAGGQWQTTTTGSEATFGWWDDPLNQQGATSPTDTPGNLIDTFMNTQTRVPPQGFSDNQGAKPLPVPDTAPFSMTEQVTLTLAGGAGVLYSQEERKESVVPVPEPSTWAMMLVGFGGLGFFGYRQTTRRAKLQAE